MSQDLKHTRMTPKKSPTTADVTLPSQAPKVEGGEGGGLASPSQRGKFTPGPWTVGENASWQQPVIRDANGTIVTMLCSSPLSNPSMDIKANAHLIAAAPELHDELQSSTARLQMCLKLTDDLNIQYDIRAHIDANRIALAKAEGRSL